MEINREEVKEEVLKVSKWARFFWMFVYSFAISAAINVAIGIAAIQFLFYLFTSKINAALFDFNKHIYTFSDDTLKFLLFETEDKPFPFKASNNDENNPAPEIVEADAETVVDANENEDADTEEASAETASNATEDSEEEPKS
mgnify:FL=1|tara:strand:+ start:43 stop:471 length:429 start_codon:yes stop_codon:yes gene_type:complete